MIRKAVLETNPEFEDVLVPQCEYLHDCPEFKSCGYWDAKKKFKEQREESDK
jgi:hypothetical protein